MGSNPSVFSGGEGGERNHHLWYSRIYTDAGISDSQSQRSYIAPYVNRIDNIGYDGVKVVKEIQDILVKNHMGCEVLTASFKNSQQVMELAAYGVSAATAASSVIDGFVKNAAIDNSVNDFIHDFEELMHPGCTMAEIPEYQR